MQAKEGHDWQGNRPRKLTSHPELVGVDDGPNRKELAMMWGKACEKEGRGQLH